MLQGASSHPVSFPDGIKGICFLDKLQSLQCSSSKIFCYYWFWHFSTAGGNGAPHGCEQLAGTVRQQRIPLSRAFQSIIFRKESLPLPALGMSTEFGPTRTEVLNSVLSADCSVWGGPVPRHLQVQPVVTVSPCYGDRDGRRCMAVLQAEGGVNELYSFRKWLEKEDEWRAKMERFKFEDNSPWQYHQHLLITVVLPIWQIEGVGKIN